MILDQDNENRYALAPYCFNSSMSSSHRLYESVATSPEEPSAMRLCSVGSDGWVKVSQIDGVRPPAVGDPSIWYAANVQDGES